MPSFYIPLSGLDADSTALNTIANNLSNMNTTGFKAQTTNFSDLFYQQVGTTGSGDEIQQGTGVQVASNSTDFTGGSISSTGVSTDAGINGTGFFVLNNNGSQLYTRDGNFQTSSSGALESTQGQGVMGYMATNGVINTASGLTPITIPIGQVMQPAATTSISMTQNLDSESAVGAKASGQIQVYDSLGKTYEATVTYTNLGDNKWSYAITMPDSLSAAPATAAAAAVLPVAGSTPAATAVPVAAAVTAPAPTTVSSLLAASAAVSTPVTNSALAAQPGTPAGTIDYNFLTSNGAVATVDPASTMKISGLNGLGVPTTTALPTFSGTPETVTNYAADLTAALATAGIVGVTVTANAVTGKVSIVGPAGTTTTAGTVGQDFSGAQSSYTFGTYIDPTSGLPKPATVDGSTSLQITAPNTSGVLTTINVPPGIPGESVGTYVGDIQTALAANDMTGVSVSQTNGVLSLTGASTMTLGGTVKQDMVGTTNLYNFATNATVDPTTTLAITGKNAAGSSVTLTAPTVISGETVAQYATALSGALTTAGITNVAVSSTAGQLSIVGANMTTSGSVVQDLADTTVNYDFGSSATVNPATNLTIVGPTVSGIPPTAVTLAPTVTAGETVTQYAVALNNALTAAGIDTGSNGVSVTATGGKLSIVGPASTLSVAGSASQDLTASTTSFTFGSSGGVVATVDPSTNLTITGQTATGGTATITAPTVISGETRAQ